MTKKLSDAEEKIWAKITVQMIDRQTQQQLDVRQFNFFFHNSDHFLKELIKPLEGNGPLMCRQEYAESLGKVRELLEVLELMRGYQAEENTAATAKEIAETTSVLAKQILQLLDALLSATGEGDGNEGT